VVHLFHTSLNLAAVMCPVHLPVAARAAPPRPPIGFADEDILAVELLEARAVGVVVWPGLISIGSLKVPFSSAPSRRLCVLFGGPRAEWCDSGVILDNEEDSEIGNEHQEKEYEV
jgi:hypothetical protein